MAKIIDMKKLRQRRDNSEGWAVRHWHGGIYVPTIMPTRRDAVATFKRMYRVKDKAWREDVKFGVHRAVRVAISVKAKLPSAEEGDRQ